MKLKTNPTVHIAVKESSGTAVAVKKMCGMLYLRDF
jgi:hypothetical protein